MKTKTLKKKKKKQLALYGILDSGSHAVHLQEVHQSLF